VTRGAPASLSGLKVPMRTVSAAQRVTCPECHDRVATRDGAIAGHYAVGTQLCTGSSKRVQEPQR
jgi:hypothetical protein